jgi:DNA mismatch repair protein MutL
MGIIKPLSQHLIAAIAAGEVAERPSQIIKELIENSLDAGATAITIQLTGSGLETITVIDNGHGMDADDLILAAQPHTTSKIATETDLEKIRTFGFRGEALHSIAQVATVSIASRPAHQPAGYLITYTNGQQTAYEPVGMPTGTTVSVSQPFANQPGRRKFINNPRRELAYILDSIYSTALIHPEVEFIVEHNGKHLLDISRHTEWFDRIHALFPAHAALPAQRAQFSHSFVTLDSWLGHPQLASKTRHHQHIFINHRPVLYPAIAKVVRQAYGSLVAPGFEPAWVLHVQLPPELIDVNVHPHKDKVMVMDEAMVLDILSKTIGETLTTLDTSYRYDLATPSTTSPLFTLRDRTTNTPLHQHLKQSTALRTLTDQLASTGEPIVQIATTYLVVSDQTGALLIDQHAAHERILFETFKAAFQAKTTDAHTQPLAEPVVVELDHTLLNFFTAHQSILENVGLVAELFGPTQVRITHAPTIMSGLALDKVFLELLQDCAAGLPVNGVTSESEKTLAYLACRSAIKAGDVLSQSERKELLAQLAISPNKLTCPHGRPTTITLDIPQLEKMFRRR